MIGITGSVFGASMVARNAGRESRQSLVTSSKEVASRLNLTLETEFDLISSMKAFISTYPNASNADFLRWVSAMDVSTRYPEVTQLGFAAAVRSSQLPQFIATVLADPPLPLTSEKLYTVTPPGVRPYYCLVRYWSSKTPPTLPIDYDLCATLSVSLTSQPGKVSYIPDPSARSTRIGIGLPIYPEGSVPSTAQARSDTFLGYAGMTISPVSLVNEALAGSSSNAVALTYGTGSSAVSFRAGSVPGGAQSSMIGLQRGWRVQVFGAVSHAGLFTNASALLLFLLGSLISLLLGALFYSVTGARSRGLGLVQMQTEQLHHQAHHDSLTGLPNRTLILDRIGVMLAHSRREHTLVAVLYL